MALTLGLPRMHKEAGEKRDFLPDFVARMLQQDVHVRVEDGLGSGMGLTNQDYMRLSPRVEITDNAGAISADVVLVLRAPEFEEFDRFRAGTVLVSMLHYSTRPRRIRKMKALGLDGLSLDGLVDDDGRRLVENTRAVGWNGLEAAFDALEQRMPARLEPGAEPVRVTLMGAGLVGKYAVEGATKYGSTLRHARWSVAGVPGVEVTTLGRQLTGDADYMRRRLAQTDILVDATQRPDASRPLIPNAWFAHLPAHAVLADLVVDPYVMTVQPPTVRSLEGIPMGSLDQWIFHPDDPGWTRTIPEGISTAERRSVVSCYSWPGIHPRECMQLYGHQLAPLLERVLARGGVADVDPRGDNVDRALWRASLRNWTEDARMVDLPEHD